MYFQGKHIGRLGHQDPGEFPEEVKALFEKAVQYYEDNMMLMVEIGDRAAQGRACGNLGKFWAFFVTKRKCSHFLSLSPPHSTYAIRHKYFRGLSKLLPVLGVMGVILKLPL